MVGEDSVIFDSLFPNIAAEDVKMNFFIFFFLQNSNIFNVPFTLTSFTKDGLSIDYITLAIAVR